MSWAWQNRDQIGHLLGQHLYLALLPVVFGIVVAVPVIIAGLRVATVSSISLVSVGQLIGIGGLGYFFTDGEQRDFPTEIYVGLVLIIVLALIFDGLLVLARRWLTPWEAGRAPRQDRRRAVTVALQGSEAGSAS